MTEHNYNIRPSNYTNKSNLSNNVDWDWDSSFTDSILPSDLSGFVSIPDFGIDSNTVTGFNTDGSFLRNTDGSFNFNDAWGGGGKAPKVDSSWFSKNLGISGKELMEGINAFGAGMEGVAALVGGFGSLKNSGIAKDSLNFNKVVARANWEQQAKLTNERLATREGTRINSNRRYQNLSKEQKDGMIAAYMGKYGANETLGG